MPSTSSAPPRRDCVEHVLTGVERDVTLRRGPAHQHGDAAERGGIGDARGGSCLLPWRCCKRRRHAFEAIHTRSFDEDDHASGGQASAEASAIEIVDVVERERPPSPKASTANLRHGTERLGSQVNPGRPGVAARRPHEVHRPLGRAPSLMSPSTSRRVLVSGAERAETRLERARVGVIGVIHQKRAIRSLASSEARPLTGTTEAKRLLRFRPALCASPPTAATPSAFLKVVQPAKLQADRPNRAATRSKAVSGPLSPIDERMLRSREISRVSRPNVITRLDPASSRHAGANLSSALTTATPFAASRRTVLPAATPSTDPKPWR